MIPKALPQKIPSTGQGSQASGSAKTHHALPIQEACKAQACRADPVQHEGPCQVTPGDTEP